MSDVGRCRWGIFVREGEGVTFVVVRSGRVGILCSFQGTNVVPGCALLWVWWVFENFIASASISTASWKEHTVDALAPRADEGRGKLR
jgi:hypothetical protein